MLVKQTLYLILYFTIFSDILSHVIILYKSTYLRGTFTRKISQRTESENVSNVLNITNISDN